MAVVASNTHDETTVRRALWLAVGIFVAFFGFYGFALVIGIFSSPKDFAGVEKIASTLGPIVATIIGFYFGQRPVGEMADKLKNTQGVATQGVQESLNTLESAQKEVERLNKIIEKQEQLISVLTRGKP